MIRKLIYQEFSSEISVLNKFAHVAEVLPRAHFTNMG